MATLPQLPFWVGRQVQFGSNILNKYFEAWKWWMEVENVLQIVYSGMQDYRSFNNPSTKWPTFLWFQAFSPPLPPYPRCGTFSLLPPWLKKLYNRRWCTESREGHLEASVMLILASSVDCRSLNGVCKPTQYSLALFVAVWHVMCSSTRMTFVQWCTMFKKR